MNIRDDHRPVILCDDQGVSVGASTVAESHTGDGQLHRAFSVFVFRRSASGFELLIHQRSPEKPLFSMFWTNTCCSHPRPDDPDVQTSAQRRLGEECGLTVSLTVAGSFVYRAEDPSGKGVEHEHDTVLVGMIDRNVPVKMDPSEVAAWKWIDAEQVKSELASDRVRYSPWFAPAFTIAMEAADEWAGA